MNFEESVIKLMKNTYSAREQIYSRDLQFLTLDLITESFDLDLLAGRAKEEGVGQRLGYLCELTAQAAERKNLQESKKLYALAGKLFEQYESWQYLNPYAPDFAKRILKKTSQTKLNKKWKILDSASIEDSAAWIEMYVIKNNADPP